MSELKMPAGDLEADLRAYFTVTTSTELPRRIREMGTRTLRSPGRRAGPAVAGLAGLVAATALAVLGVTHLPQTGNDTASLSQQSGAAPIASPSRGQVGSVALTYPGVDVTRLAANGVVLLAPEGRTTVTLGPAQAQAAATRAVGGAAGHPGPAVLAIAELPGGRPADTCLCWVVDVPVTLGTVVRPAATTPPRTQLVLVDAADGRIVAVLTGNGIP